MKIENGYVQPFPRNQTCQLTIAMRQNRQHSLIRVGAGGYCCLAYCLLRALGSRREDALQRDIKIVRQVRHHVVVRLVAAGRR